MYLGSQIRQKRIQVGLTQVELSARSGVSLPGLQGIEAGKGNPSFKTLKKLFSVLGIKMELTNEHSDWDKLTSLGLPLSSVGNTKNTTHFRSKDELINEIKKAGIDVLNNEAPSPRHTKAFVALNWAIKLLFPSVYKELVSNFPNINRILKLHEAEESIKLQRIARERISRYL